MNVQIVTQFLTVTSQHRLVFDWHLRQLVVLVIFFQRFILYQYRLLPTNYVRYNFPKLKTFTKFEMPSFTLAKAGGKTVLDRMH